MITMDFTPGQRWISNSENELGLGIIIAASSRQVTVLFPACNEKRIYASNNAPLTRVVFDPDDTITSQQGWQLQISKLSVTGSVICYHGTRLDNQQPTTLFENDLDSQLVFGRPQDRLFAGQSDPLDHFMLRYRARQCYCQHYAQYQQHQLHNQQHLATSGLRGARTSLIPHQLYIAHEVAHRFAPRVLLADEVGLGKTIEAGLIIHQRILAGSTERVLIVVPQTLQHQWLVEMLRRFNLHFALFDEERYGAVLSDNANPFDSEQLIICSLDFICASPQRLEFLALADWDLLVVDEAHHLVWDDTAPSTEYCAVEMLAKVTPAVLLLTATPEQLGMNSHFARLRLLDSDRFHSLNQFLQEQQHYQPVVQAVTLLLDNHTLQAEQCQYLTDIVSEQDISDLLQQANSDGSQRISARQQLISLLLDRHGTSRILFRNTRHGVAGFPRRQLHRIELPLPDAYQVALAQHAGSYNHQNNQQSDARPDTLLCPEQPACEQLYHVPLCPELLCPAAPDGTPWYNFDPRVSWLTEYLLQHRQQKVLVICASASTALNLEQVMREKSGIRASVFHEEMSIIERDRAAAWFADLQSGAQVLLCSEIGSEGRNFQFASTLVMFDLPLNPDLLEQRIGRLDRIGQKHDVQIYVPYLRNTAQALLLRWYHHGLNAFEHTCSTGRPLFDALYPRLVHYLLTASLTETDNNCGFDQLIADCYQQHQVLKQQLEQGRDRLLELHSCGGEAARQLADNIAAADNNSALLDFCNILFDIIGIHYEELDEQLYSLTPHSTMLIPDFPGIPRDGCSITYSREVALAREDVQFLTWEHPIIRNGLDLILTSDMGTCSLALLKFPELPAGTLLLQLLYVVETRAARQLQLQRFLPPTPVRLLLDKNGNNMANVISFSRLQNRLQSANRQLTSKLGRMVQSDVRQILQQAEPQAQQAAQLLIDNAHQQASDTLYHEINRLQALQAINPTIRHDEIQALHDNREQVLNSLSSARCRLDALQLIVVAE